MKTTWVRLLFIATIITSPTWGITDYFIPTLAGSSAESVRLGQIGMFSDLSNTIFENPASTYKVNQFSATAFTATFMEEVQYINGTATTRFAEGVVSLGYMRVGVEGIPETFNAGTDSEVIAAATGRSFSYSNDMIKLGYQYSQNENISWGVALSLFNTSLYNVTGGGWNVDAGIIMDYNPLVMSFTASNVIPGLGVNYSNGGKEKLPLQLAYGVAYDWYDLRWLGKAQISDGLNKNIFKAIAVNYHPEFLGLLNLSVGYRDFPVLKDTKSSITTGVGLVIEGFSFDYAFETSDHILYNGKHYFSVGFLM